MKHDLKVDQIIWVKNDKGVFEKTINKVGRKYFYVNYGKWSEIKFSIETMQEIKDGGYQAKAYLSLQDIEDEKESKRILRLLGDAFRYNTDRYNLSQLKQVSKILDLNK